MTSRNYDASATDLDRQSREILAFNEAMRNGRLCSCGGRMYTMVHGNPACMECADVLTWHERYEPQCDCGRNVAVSGDLCDSCADERATAGTVWESRTPVLCAECREPIADTDAKVDNFVYKCGELQYIELAHNRCAPGWA